MLALIIFIGFLEEKSVLRHFAVLPDGLRVQENAHQHIPRVSRTDVGQVGPDPNRSEHRRLGKQIVLRHGATLAPAASAGVQEVVLCQVFTTKTHLHIHRGTRLGQEIAGLRGVCGVGAVDHCFPFTNRQTKHGTTGRITTGHIAKPADRLLHCGEVFLTSQRLDIQHDTLVSHLLGVACGAAVGLVNRLTVAGVAKQRHGIAKLDPILGLGVDVLQPAQLVAGAKDHRGK